MRSIRILPRDPQDSGWLESLPPRPARRRLEGDEKADFVIIGAGFCGLAMARRLHELRPDARVVVVDALQVGQGASGRSSGFVVDLTDSAALMKPAIRDGYIRLARGGIDHLRELVAEHGFDCDWDDKGWVRACVADAGEYYLDRLPPMYDELGMAYEPLSGERMTEITGTTFYRKGLRITGYPLVHSGKLVRALADHLPEAVTVFEESPITGIEVGPPHRLRSTHGTITCGRLLLATNGYSPYLGYFGSRVFPLYTFGSLTRELTPEEQERLGGEREWGVLAMDPMGSSVRRSRGQRILIRNMIYYNRKLEIGEAKRQQAIASHRHAFESRFPMLEGVEFEHTWGGLMGSAHNSMLTFGKVGPEVYGVVGFTAAGIAMGTAAGRVLAEHCVGEQTQGVRDIQALPRATWMPPEPFRSIGGAFLAERMNGKADPATL